MLFILLHGKDIQVLGLKKYAIELKLVLQALLENGVIYKLLRLGTSPVHIFIGGGTCLFL
jgi:hypothetical protein